MQQAEDDADAPIDTSAVDQNLLTAAPPGG